MRAVLQADVNDDLMVVNAARVSFAKRSIWAAPGVLREPDERLIHYLARHKHWSPFAHPQLLVQLRMSQGEMLGWLLRRNPAGFRTYPCQAPDEYLEKGSLYAWAENLPFLPREVALGVAAILWKRFPYSARALGVPRVACRGDRVRPVSLRSVTDEWMAGDLGRAVLSTRSFVIEAALPVARQLVKHEEGLAWNEVSRRYVDSTPRLETPTHWRRRAAAKKQGSSQEATEFPPVYLAVDENEEVEFALEEVLTALRDGYDAAVAPDGPWQVCPEQARYVLPQSMLTEWWWTGSVADFARVCRDRLGADAQSETTEVARAIAAVFQEICPLTWRALVPGRV